MNHSSMIATTLSEAYSFPTNSLIIKNIIYHHMNKTVLITGASSGIGAGCARKFASQGARVILNARSTDKLESLAGELKS